MYSFTEKGVPEKIMLILESKEKEPESYWNVWLWKRGKCWLECILL